MLCNEVFYITIFAIYVYSTILFIMQMPKKTVVEKDCTQNCKSARHIQQLVSLIYLPAVHVNDDQIASYLVNTSNCFKNVSSAFCNS